ncbi:MAG: hypothetical protein ACKO2G_13805 [Verrucomicrobiales bacterium]
MSQRLSHVFWITLVAAICGGALVSPSSGQVLTPGEANVRYAEPIIEPAVFKFDDLGMAEIERRQYAENLAAFALLAVAEKYADEEGKLTGVPQEKYDLARKLVGLALHLDPRSRPAVIANGRLKTGVVPKKSADPSMAAGSFSSLLVGRAEELRKPGGADNLRLAGCFLDLAVALDPTNDDAIYAFETFKLDGHKANWTGILGGE